MTSQILVLGGPHHGQMVTDEGRMWMPMVMASDPGNPLLPPVAMPTRYVMRELDGMFEEGKRRRSVYAHESIGNAMELAQMLANVLIGMWLKDGGELVEDTHNVVPGGPEARTAAMGGEPPRSTGGLYLPG